MKKISFLILLLSAAVTIHAAKVGFLVVGASDSESALPWEGGDWDGSKNLCEISPEKAAYLWFKNTYSAASKECILISTLQASSSKVPDDIDVLWVNLDRTTTDLNWEGEKSYDAIFNANVVNALKEFVKRGGNLLLTKQAVRLVAMIGRTSDWPSVEINTGGAENLDKNASTDSVQQVMSRLYKVFDGCTFYHDNLMYPLSSSAYTFDREAVWSKNDAAASTFQTDNKCRILGRDRGTYDKVGFVEFDPATISDVKFKGTVLVMGLRGYLWSNDNSNTLKANVQKLTQNMLDYLSVKPSDASVNWQGWETAASGYIGGSLAAATAPTAGDHIASVSAASYASSDANVASVNASTGAIDYNYFGSATVTSTVTVAGDGQWVPKNVAEVSKEKSVTVSGGNEDAPIGYLLTSGQHLNLANEEGDIPNPDKAAAQWFHTNYVATNRGQFIDPANAIPDAVQTLWIHSDRKNLESETYMTELGGGAFVGKLRTYLSAGKNLFVSKQATRLIGDLQRLGNGVYPTYGASRTGTDSWDYGTHGPFRVGNSFTEPVSEVHSTHTIYKTMDANPILITSGTHTNRNYVININDWAGLTTHEAFDTYQTTHDCRLLGDWGNDASIYECGGLIEFYPKDGVGEGANVFDQRGTIMMLGLAAYQWVNPTENTRTLTSNILSYLATTSAPELTWVDEPVDGEVALPQNVSVSFADGAVAWYQTDGDGAVSIDENPDHPYESEYRVLNFTREGSVTVTAQRTGDGYAVPRNVTPTSLSKTINVATNIYTRDVSAIPNYYGTICLPRAAASYEGATMFRLVDKTPEDGIIIEEVTSMEAGVPYIFYPTADEVRVTMTGNKETAKTANGLVGYIGETSTTLSPNDNHYILAYNKIWKLDVPVEMPSNRAYIDMTAIASLPHKNGMRRVTIGGNGAPTGIDEVTNASAKVKFIKDGQLLIIRDNHIFNVLGQRIQ